MTPRSAARIAILLVAAVILSLGCAPAIPPEAPWEKDARALLDHAEALYAKKQYDQALKTAEGFLATYPKSRYGDRALSLMGEVQITSRNFAGALRSYRELIERYPSSSMIAEAKYKIGLCFFELKEYDLAIDNLSDRSRITDPAKLQRIAEMLSSAYLAKGRYLPATRELAYLAENAANEKQRSGYRDRVRELVDRKLSADELRAFADAPAYPADLALLRLSALEIEQRQYADALASAKAFLTRYPNHPEKTRAEMLAAEATVKLTAPRYQLGILVPQTGPASFFGERVLKGIQLAVLSYNTQNPEDHVELIVKDTEGMPDKAAAAYTELAGKGVAAIVGPLLSREVEALVPALNKSPVPVFTPTASGTGIAELSPWIFRNALTNAAQAAAAAEYGIRQKAAKFVIIHPDDPYGRDLARIFTRDVGRKAEILATIPYPAEANDFGPYIRRLIEIDLRSQKIPIPEDDQERKKLFQAYAPSFDALYLPGSAEKVGLLLPQLAFYNVKGKIVIGSNNWHTHDLVERAGLYAEGAVFIDGVYPESEDPAVKTVVDAYRSAYQEEPDILSAQAYDAAAMILMLLKERKDTPAAIREGLLAIRNYPGISGMTSFTGSGDAQKQLFLIKVENGMFTLATE
jgi:ABC-type branched-subunit amino acid transport system substrate-binding protein